MSLLASLLLEVNEETGRNAPPLADRIELMDCSKLGGVKGGRMPRAYDGLDMLSLWPYKLENAPYNVPHLSSVSNVCLGSRDPASSEGSAIIEEDDVEDVVKEFSILCNQEKNLRAFAKIAF